MGYGSITHNPAGANKAAGGAAGTAVAAGPRLTGCDTGVIPPRHAGVPHDIRRGRAVTRAIRLSRADCRRRAEQLFDAETMTDHYEALYGAELQRSANAAVAARVSNA